MDFDKILRENMYYPVNESMTEVICATSKKYTHIYFVRPPICKGKDTVKFILFNEPNSAVQYVADFNDIVDFYNEKVLFCVEELCEKAPTEYNLKKKLGIK